MELTDRVALSIDVCCWDKIYRKDIISELKLRFPEGMIHEDDYFHWMYLSKCKTAYFDKRCYHRYCKNDQSLTSTIYKSNKAIDHLVIVKMLFDYFKAASELNNHY